MRTSKRAVLVEPMTPIEIWDGPVPAATGGDVVASIQMAGVCGTDHHFTLGEVPLPGPMVLGHEAVGIIEDIGPDVTTDAAGEAIALGDRIYWIPAQACHRCHACTVAGDESMCPTLLAGLFQDAKEPPVGCYSEFSVIPAGMAFFKIPDDTPTEAVIALGCALPTMLQAMERLGKIEYGQTVVVQGCGPVGLAATLLARLAGAGDITVIGAPAARLAMAERLGATATIDLGEVGDPDARVAAVRDATSGRGVDVVIEAAGKLPAFDEGLRLVAPGGRYLIVGLWSAPGTVQIEPRMLNNNNIRIIGSALEAPRHVHQAVQVARIAHRDFPLAEVVSHRYQLDQSQEALEAVGRLETVKAVIVPAG